MNILNTVSLIPNLYPWLAIPLGIAFYLTLTFSTLLILKILPNNMVSFGPFRKLKKVKFPIALLLTLPPMIWFFEQIDHTEVSKKFSWGLVRAFFFLAVFWILYQFSFFIFDRAKILTSRTRSKLDDQFIPILEKIFRFLVITFGTLMILQSFGLDVFSLVAGLGLGGLALALAAKDTAANFFGSLMIILDQPFNIGDWVKVGDVEGTVEDIGIRSTRIRTFYHSVQVVPNSTMATSTIDNMGRRKFRRFKHNVGFEYGTSKEAITNFSEALKNWLTENSSVVQDQTQVRVNGLSGSSIDVLVYVFFAVSDWKTELIHRENLIFKILELSEACKAPLAFPSQTLYLENTLAPN